jgi:hypothetical protein
LRVLALAINVFGVEILKEEEEDNIGRHYQSIKLRFAICSPKDSHMNSQILNFVHVEFYACV